MSIPQHKAPMAQPQKLLGEKDETTNEIPLSLDRTTWELPLVEGRAMYTARIRQAMAYAAHVWHQPIPVRSRRDCFTPTLSRIQHHCFRLISGAFRATSTQHLESFTVIPPLEIHLTTQTTFYQRKTELSGLSRLSRFLSERIWL